MLRRTLGLLAILIPVAILLLLILWHPFLVHVAQETGTSNEASRAYGFWSGFGSDLGEATIVVGLVAAYRHRNCHVRRCPFLGQKVEGTPYIACPRHHPAHQGEKRGVSVHTLLHAHQQANLASDTAKEAP